MSPLSEVPEVADIIVHHHERWDGGGYPSGLAEEAIPLGARVVNVADTFDAMTTNRPYQRAMTFEVAAHKISTFSGKGTPASVRIAAMLTTPPPISRIIAVGTSPPARWIRTARLAASHVAL